MIVVVEIGKLETSDNARDVHAVNPLLQSKNLAYHYRSKNWKLSEGAGLESSFSLRGRVTGLRAVQMMPRVRTSYANVSRLQENGLGNPDSWILFNDFPAKGDYR